MLEEPGRIVAIDNDSLWVETIQNSTCGRCAAQKGCGQSLLSRFGAKPIYLRVLLAGRNSGDFRINQSITIGIPNDIVVKSALFVYLLPVLFALVLSIIAHKFIGLEWLTITTAAFGLLLGGVLIRWHFKRYNNDERYQAVIVDRNSSSELLLPT